MSRAPTRTLQPQVSVSYSFCPFYHSAQGVPATVTQEAHEFHVTKHVTQSPPDIAPYLRLQRLILDSRLSQGHALRATPPLPGGVTGRTQPGRLHPNDIGEHTESPSLADYACRMVPAQTSSEYTPA